MKYDKKEPETMDADPMRLLVSAILAFTVMLFINGFVGSMGGFPAFVAFTLVFFRIRTRAGMENGGMQQELADRQITGRLLWKYAAGYLVLWGILRIAFLISRVTGWGNINGASAVEYVRQMWNTSLLEKWAYFFAGMIMFAFVLSLFPLAVIREKVRWIRYALVDGAVFALVCLGINGVCRLKFEQKSSGRATCLIDHLLLCGRMRTWQEITCLLAMVVFILVIGAFVFSYASRQYAVKNIDVIPASAGEEESRRHRMIRKIVTVGCSIAAAAIVVVIVLLLPKDTAGDYTKVAEFLTEDTRMGPMEYGDAVYVRIWRKTELPRAIWQSVESAATVGFISLRLQIFCIPIRPEKQISYRQPEPMEEHMHRWHWWKQTRHGKRMMCFFSGMKTGLWNRHIRMSRQVMWHVRRI